MAAAAVKSGAQVIAERRFLPQRTPSSLNRAAVAHRLLPVALSEAGSAIDEWLGWFAPSGQRKRTRPGKPRERK
jgi:hypothetical protein